MTQTPSSAGPTTLEEEEPLRRVIGRLRGPEPGPTLVCIGGIHGNEPAGVEALGRVFHALSRRHLGIQRGEFVGLSGNLGALAQRRRFLAKDLNRQWVAGGIEVDETSANDTAEDQERQELLAELEDIFGRSSGETFILDLHTTSGEGAPFVAVGDTLCNRRFALKFPLPLILGLEEHLDGTISEYLSNRGCVTATVETGQHDSPAAVDHAEAAIWLALRAAGLVDGAEPAEVRRAGELLARAADGLPRVLELCYRHTIHPSDRFRMEPGFHNFMPVVPGQLLAVDRRGEIRSRWSGRVLMPLYQELGSDGFFIVREFKPIWLAVSALLRRLHLDAIVHLLPGITRHRSRPNTLVVDRRIARWYSMEVLHLLGFRRQRAVGGVLLISRRRHDANHRSSSR